MPTYKDYKENGSKDEYGILREETALKSLMKKQHNFMTEVTLLQLHAQKMGVMIDCSPKCHPEIAGKGIEYVWSLTKLKYRFMRINTKRSTKAFHDAVAENVQQKVIEDEKTSGNFVYFINGIKS